MLKAPGRGDNVNGSSQFYSSNVSITENSDIQRKPNIANMIEASVKYRYNFHSHLNKGLLQFNNIFLRILTGSEKVDVHFFTCAIDCIEDIDNDEKNDNLRIVGKAFQWLELYNVSKSIKDELIKRIYFHDNRSAPPAFSVKKEIKPPTIIVPIEWSHDYFGKNEIEKELIELSGWKLETKINADYSYCSTYPTHLIIHQKFSIDLLKLVCQHRSRGRFPTVSWVHPQHKMTLCRSSQPRSGLINKRSKDDENYLEFVLPRNRSKSVIFDARPWLNAQANRMRDGGVEVSSNSDYVYLDIDNIQVVKKSHDKLKKACMNLHLKKTTIDKVIEVFLKQGWAQQLNRIMKGAIRLTKHMEDGNPLLIHCSDGWDRTAILTALVMIMSDSYYRTIDGFCRLIDREWCAMGHQFAVRLGHGTDTNKNERAPIFLQFIECVRFLKQLFKDEFEFNDLFLIHIILHSYSCCFGNFLYNCEQDRRNQGVFIETISIWNYLSEKRGHFQNVYYNPTNQQDSNQNQQQLPLYPQRKFTASDFWTEWYLLSSCPLTMKDTPPLPLTATTATHLLSHQFIDKQLGLINLTTNSTNPSRTNSFQLKL